MMTSKARVHMVDLMEMSCRNNDQTVCGLITRRCLKTEPVKLQPLFDIPVPLILFKYFLFK